MAQYRLSVDYVSRTKGQSAVARAAYRAGERLHDRRYGETQDYTRRTGVVHTEVVLPDRAPAWAADREDLWNRVEAAEKRADAQLARDIELNLPHELGADQRRAVALEFARHVADRYGFAVDIAIHKPGREGDNRNHHAHVLFPTRPFDEARESGFSKTKDRRFNAVAMERDGGENEVESLREVWEMIQNRALERAAIRDANGQPVRVDRRSYERQGIEQEPMVKEGPAATGIKRRGEASERAAMNAEIQARNALREQTRASLEEDLQLLAELKAQKAHVEQAHLAARASVSEGDLQAQARLEQEKAERLKQLQERFEAFVAATPQPPTAVEPGRRQAQDRQQEDLKRDFQRRVREAAERQRKQPGHEHEV